MEGRTGFLVMGDARLPIADRMTPKDSNKRRGKTDARKALNPTGDEWPVVLHSTQVVRSRDTRARWSRIMADTDSGGRFAGNRLSLLFTTLEKISEPINQRRVMQANKAAENSRRVNSPSVLRLVSCSLAGIPIQTLIVGGPQYPLTAVIPECRLSLPGQAIGARAPRPPHQKFTKNNTLNPRTIHGPTIEVHAAQEAHASLQALICRMLDMQKEEGEVRRCKTGLRSVRKVEAPVRGLRHQAQLVDPAGAQGRAHATTGPSC